MIMRRRVFIILLGIVFFYFGAARKAQAVHGTHLVISEIQTGGAVTDDEFIELYNTTGAAIDISNWSIQYKAATGATIQKKNFVGGASVAAHGYYFIARSLFDGGVAI